MNEPAEKDNLEKQMAEQIVSATPLMDGVDGISVELGDDHSGDPSMWLVLHLRRGLRLDDKWIDEFNYYSGNLSMKIIDSSLTRFPYTRLERAA